MHCVQYNFWIIKTSNNLIYVPIILYISGTSSTRYRVCFTYIYCCKRIFIMFHNASVKLTHHQIQTYILIKHYNVCVCAIHLKGCIYIYIYSSSSTRLFPWTLFCISCWIMISSYMILLVTIAFILTITASCNIISECLKSHI